LLAAAALMILIVGSMILALAAKSMPSIRQFGFSFVAGTDWDPVKNEFGALPFVYGTIGFIAHSALDKCPAFAGIRDFPG